MIEIWDYFMRRKSLLLAVLAVFFISGVLSASALRNNNSELTLTYISIRDWGAKTFADDHQDNPHDSANNNLSDTQQNSNIIDNSDDAVQNPDTNNPNDDIQNTDTITNSNDTAEDFEIPRTGGETNIIPFVAVMNPGEVTQILPPAEIADSTSEDPNRSSADSATVETAEPYQIVEQPENIVNFGSTTKSTSHQPRHNLFYNLFLAVMGILVLTLGGYLTYWHFRR